MVIKRLLPSLLVVRMCLVVRLGLDRKTRVSSFMWESGRTLSSIKANQQSKVEEAHSFNMIEDVKSDKTLASAKCPTTFDRCIDGGIGTG